MKPYTFDDVYFTLLGEIHGTDAVPGVENAYENGSQCDLLYSELCDAYARLRLRLGVREEDTDVEVIIGNLLAIQRILCERIFRYGQQLR